MIGESRSQRDQHAGDVAVEDAHSLLGYEFEDVVRGHLQVLQQLVRMLDESQGLPAGFLERAERWHASVDEYMSESRSLELAVLHSNDALLDLLDRLQRGEPVSEEWLGDAQQWLREWTTEIDSDLNAGQSAARCTRSSTRRSPVHRRRWQRWQIP